MPDPGGPIRAGRNSEENGAKQNASSTDTWDVVVVGGGPAGMTAAARAGERGLRVLLVEKNHTLGKKLLISGGGRCNVTNATTDRHILTAKYGKKGVHLHSLFARFGPEETRELLRRFGLETKVEAEGRVFPVTDSAASVRDVLEIYMRAAGVVVRRGRPVAALAVTRDDDDLPRVTGVRMGDGELIWAGEVILATGGLARPDTGSTGDAFPWLRELGVPVRLAESALVPITVRDGWVRRLQGVALPEAELVVELLEQPVAGARERSVAVRDRREWANSRRVLSRRGKLLFTHFGLSGPLVLNASEEVRDFSRKGAIRLLVNPLPGTDPAKLDRHFTTVVANAGKRSVLSVVRELVLPRLAETVCELAGVDPTERCATLSRAARREIVATLTGMPCSFGGLMGQEKAVVSSGGVEAEAVDFRTMRLRGVKNLYVLGDLLDFNRQSGGYSLQVCWAGGWVAGEACGEARR